jgi:glycosyltransferase involved in cell wall biosynthesis
MDPLPKISVVTPSFNQGRYLAELIESVLAQGDPHFEHIVMDGGSTDETVDVLRRYPHVKWRSEKDGGQSDAVCKALALATGEYVSWINSDDFYYPGAFAAAREAFARDPSLDIVSGDYRFVDERGRVTRSRREVAFDRAVYLYAGKSYLGNAATFFRKRVLDLHGGPRLDLDYAMDFELFLRVSATAKFGHLRRFLACYRLHGGSKTVTESRSQVREGIEVQLEYLSRQRGGAPLAALPLGARLLGRLAMARRIARKFFSGCYLRRS